VLIASIWVVLAASLVLANGLPPQDDNRLVCYVLGLYDLSGEFELHSIVRMGDTVYAERTFAPTNEPFRDAVAQVLVPVGAIETQTISDGINTFTFEYVVSDFTDTEYGKPNRDCLPAIGDGRLNDGADQLGAPLAAYCKQGGMEVWDISDVGAGTLGFTVTADEIAAGLASAAASGQSVLISSGLGNSLYAGAQGQLVLTGPDVKEPGKTYTFAFPGNTCAT
jgi:hypothetical protein